MIKYELEFYYNNVEIQIMNFLGYNYYFHYAGIEYSSLFPYINIGDAKMNAKLHVNNVIRKSKNSDELDMNV